jgi:ankyrin repeat protein
MKRLFFKSGFIVALCFIFWLPAAIAGPDDDLVAACKKGDLEAVKKALAEGADVNKADASGNPAIASAFFWPEITALLIEKGADPNLGVYPALISACNVYSTDVVRMLLAAGADPKKPGISDPAATFRTLIANEKAKGKDANQAAIKAWENAASTMIPSEVELMRVLVQQTNCVPCLQMTLDNGADIDFKDGDNAVDVLASFSMSKEERKTAFRNGASAMESFGFKVPDWYRDLPDDRNGTAVEMLNLLLTKAPDMNKPNTNGLTPLVVALKSCNAVPEGKASKLSVVKKLVEAGANPALAAKQKLDKGEAIYYPICLAAEYGDVELMAAMLGKGADINSATTTACLSMYNGTWGGEGYTPVIIATMVKNFDVARYLVEHEADIKLGTNGYSIMETSLEEVKCLVSSKNKIPIYWAVEKNDMDLVHMIADRMVWQFNPDFTYNVISDVSQLNMGTYSVGCKKGKEKMSPSAYASEIGNKEAAKYLGGKGL